ncbi:hypothetical protein AZK39_09235 [Streptococcus pneumoniae]|nr:hypothetical protein AZK39_09235 [Streptococcus pneumoniae]
MRSFSLHNCQSPEQFKGPIPVIIRYEEEQKTIVSPHHFVAKSNELEEKLNEIVMKTIYR